VKNAPMRPASVPKTITLWLSSDGMKNNGRGATYVSGLARTPKHVRHVAVALSQRHGYRGDVA
jgi:hypothetical protein